MMKLAKRYSFFLTTLALLLIVLFVHAETAYKAVNTAGFTLVQMLLIVPPVFILLGLLDEWVPREYFMQFMGDNSGIVGIVLAFIIGSAAAGPLYAAFPIATVLMKKGVKFTNILIFLGAWSTTKIPTLVFEMSTLGPRFTLTRLAVNIAGVTAISYLLSYLHTEEQIRQIYAHAETLQT